MAQFYPNVCKMWKSPFRGLGVFFFLFSFPAFAQRPVQMRNLWAKPRVHVLFQGYTISYTVKDINKALALLVGTGVSAYGNTSKLDTGKDYFIELFPSLDMEYHNALQPLIQNGVGAFLLTAGHALVENKKHKICKEIIEDISTDRNTDNALITFYDPKTKKMIFFGKMNVNMYNKDLGIDIEE